MIKSQILFVYLYRDLQFVTSLIFTIYMHSHLILQTTTYVSVELIRYYTGTQGGQMATQVQYIFKR